MVKILVPLLWFVILQCAASSCIGHSTGYLHLLLPQNEQKLVALINLVAERGVGTVVRFESERVKIATYLGTSRAILHAFFNTVTVEMLRKTDTAILRKADRTATKRKLVSVKGLPDDYCMVLTFHNVGLRPWTNMDAHRSILLVSLYWPYFEPFTFAFPNAHFIPKLDGLFDLRPASNPRNMQAITNMIMTSLEEASIPLKDVVPVLKAFFPRSRVVKTMGRPGQAIQCLAEPFSVVAPMQPVVQLNEKEYITSLTYELILAVGGTAADGTFYMYSLRIGPDVTPSKVSSSFARLSTAITASTVPPWPKQTVTFKCNKEFEDYLQKVVSSVGLELYRAFAVADALRERLDSWAKSGNMPADVFTCLDK